MNSGTVGECVREAKKANPGINGFFITQLGEVIGDLIKFGGQKEFRPQQTIRNMIVRLKTARDYRDDADEDEDDDDSKS